MADAEHLSILAKGVEEWNRWRVVRKYDPRYPFLKGEMTIPNLQGWNGDFLKTFDVDRFIAAYSPHPGELAELVAEQRGGSLHVDIERTGWMTLEGVDFRCANLRSANLSLIDLSKSRLWEADLSDAILDKALLYDAELWNAKMQGARLRGASLARANLSNADLTNADLTGASLYGANLSGAILRGAQLSGADLEKAILVETDLQGANISGAHVYGIAAWQVQLQDAVQTDLQITKRGEPVITLDNLEMAQFIHMMLSNQRLRSVIDTITSKAVLILGRFTPSRKPILDALRTDLRRQDFLPIIFDFDVPTYRDTDETVNLLARMSRFVVADLTEGKSVLQELKGIVEALPSVPVQPLLATFDQFHGMFDHLRRYPWVLEPIRYDEADFNPTALSALIIERTKTKLLEIHR